MPLLAVMAEFIGFCKTYMEVKHPVLAMLKGRFLLLGDGTVGKNNHGCQVIGSEVVVEGPTNKCVECQ